MVLNLFRAVAHFKGLQIFVAHFQNIFDVMMTMSLGSALDLLTAEVISIEKKGHYLPGAENGRFEGVIAVDL